ncbi:MAG: hypothetical protein AAF081_09060 [Actinomycetota bacterium]
MTSLVEAEGRTELALADGRRVSVPLAVNRRSASEMRASVRRLTAVEIDSERRSAIAVGTGWRRPFMRPIPVSMALGLIAAGVPGVAR